MRQFFVIILLVFSLVSCFKERDNTIPPPYTGPSLIIDTMNGIYSDSAELVFKYYTPRQVKLFNEDQEYPLGLEISSFKDDSIEESYMRSDYAYNFDKEGYWKITGNVVVINKIKFQKLETDEIYWKPKEHRLWTEAKVTVTTADQVLKGVGLTAKDDFSEYELLQPEMIYFIEAEE